MAYESRRMQASKAVQTLARDLGLKQGRAIPILDSEIRERLESNLLLNFGISKKQAKEIVDATIQMGIMEVSG